MAELRDFSWTVDTGRARRLVFTTTAIGRKIEKSRSGLSRRLHGLTFSLLQTIPFLRYGTQGPHDCDLGLFFCAKQFFHHPFDLRHGCLRTMAARQDRITIEVHPPADDGSAVPDRLAIADGSILRLARLLGRQIAREQFERRQAKERRLKRKPRAGEKT